MLWITLALFMGWFLAAGVTGGVFRVHDEWAWMRPRRACLICEVPRTGADLLPLWGDLRARARCRSCGAFVPWQYPLIELVIIALTVFHVWRYVEGVWLPAAATDLLWLWLARDIVLTLFLIIIFVYDFKYSLIFDRYTIPAAVAALVANALLGVSIGSLVFGILVLFALFLLQNALSRGRLMGAGDVRMGVLMGAMLGLTHGVFALAMAYVLGALVGIALLLARCQSPHDRVPFGPFLAVASFVMLVWGDTIVALL